MGSPSQSRGGRCSAQRRDYSSRRPAVSTNCPKEEFLSWERAFEIHGLAGLRVTRIQQYRSPRAARARSASSSQGRVEVSRRLAFELRISPRVALVTDQDSWDASPMNEPRQCPASRRRSIIEKWRMGSANWPASAASPARGGSCSSSRPVTIAGPIISTVERANAVAKTPLAAVARRDRCAERAAGHAPARLIDAPAAPS